MASLVDKETAVERLKIYWKLVLKTAWRALQAKARHCISLGSSTAAKIWMMTSTGRPVSFNFSSLLRVGLAVVVVVAERCLGSALLARFAGGGNADKVDGSCSGPAAAKYTFTVLLRNVTTII